MKSNVSMISSGVHCSGGLPPEISSNRLADLIDQPNIEVINTRRVLGDLFIFNDDFLGQRIARCQVEIAIICRRGKLGAELRPMHVTLFLRPLKENVMRI